MPQDGRGIEMLLLHILLTILKILGILLLIAVGDDAAIRAMAENDRQQRRYSGLRWRLAHFALPTETA